MFIIIVASDTLETHYIQRFVCFRDDNGNPARERLYISPTHSTLSQVSDHDTLENDDLSSRSAPIDNAEALKVCDNKAVDEVAIPETTGAVKHDLGQMKKAASRKRKRSEYRFFTFVYSLLKSIFV